jgi:hypothetical protein
MSLKEPVHPAERYVNLFLVDMLEAERWSCSARSSEALPTIKGHEPPQFARFRNRLKIMGGLDPVVYPAPRAGKIDLVILDRSLEGKWYDCHYTVRLLFNDLGDDPSVDLSAELTQKEPGVDPDLCLY